jgi:endogenous inhibitor of DNA gyrase (YacG/DUF329 family)
MEDDLDFLCPECGTPFTEGAASCPGCGVPLDWEEEEEYPHPEDVLEGGPTIEPTGPELHGGLFSTTGLVFAFLTMVAFIATVLALRWDTWIGGEPEETIGDRQLILIYAGAAGTAICAIIALVDSLRHIPFKE